MEKKIVYASMSGVPKTAYSSRKPKVSMPGYHAAPMFSGASVAYVHHPFSVFGRGDVIDGRPLCPNDPCPISNSHHYEMCRHGPESYQGPIYASVMPRPVSVVTVHHEHKVALPPGIDAWRYNPDPVVTIDHHKMGDPSLAPLDQAVNVQAKLYHNCIVQKPGVQSEAVMVSVAETLYESLNKAAAPVDIVCAIDISGSMKGEKMAKVKQTLKYLLTVAPGSRLALVTFNKDAAMLMNFKTIGKDSAVMIDTIIDTVKPAGNTNVVAGVKLAQSMLLTSPTSNAIKTILVLTDGKHNVGPISNFILFGDQSMSAVDYTLHTFGYGDDHDAAIMQSMAEHMHGNYYFVNRADKIAECFGDCLGMVTTTLATKAVIKVELIPNDVFPEISFSKLYGSYWKKVTPKIANLSLKNIYSGFNKDFMFIVQVGGNGLGLNQPAQYPAIKLTLEMTDANKNKKVTIQRTVAMKVVPQSLNVPIMLDKSVHKNLIRVEAAEIIEKCNNLKSLGKLQDAIVTLNGLKNKLASEKDSNTDEVIKSLLQQVITMINMIQNDMKGVKNTFKTDNFMMQQLNIFRNQATAPQFEQVYYQNKCQTSNVVRARNFV